MTAFRRGTTAVVATGALAVACLAVSAGPAAAQPAVPAAPAGNKLVFEYDAVGTSYIAKPASTVSLGPAVLTTKLSPDGSFTATLPLPPTSSRFAVLGLIPISATVTFVPVGKATGALQFIGARGTVTTTAKYYLQLSNVKVAGLPTPVGSTCRTAAPVVIPLATPDDQAFDIENGGPLTGSYTIGAFANCGLTTALINQLVPGPGNTVAVTVSNGRLRP